MLFKDRPKRNVIANGYVRGRLYPVQGITDSYEKINTNSFQNNDEHQRLMTRIALYYSSRHVNGITLEIDDDDEAINVAVFPLRVDSCYLASKLFDV